MDELFAAVRGACSASTWSRAVELVRRLSVTGERSDEEELVCRVKSPTRLTPHTVQLYPDDAEWACDCDARAPCCEHVAAAVIAVRKANAEGHALPQGRSHEARLLHRFTRHRGELSLARVLIAKDDSESELSGTLATALARGSDGLGVSPSQQDLAVDRALGPRTSGPLPPELCASVIKLLAGARNVELDGTPVEISSAPLTPIARVRDAADGGFVIALAADPRITEVIASGVALADRTLHPLGDTSATGAKLERLPDEKHYPKHEAATLVTAILPGLMKSFSVEVETRALPEITRSAKPRALLDVEQQAGKLSALLTLVYGDPPIARIDAGRLVHLQGPIPIRDEALEKRTAALAREQLGLTLGSRVLLEGDAATELATRLDAWTGEIRGAPPARFIRSEALAPSLSQAGDSYDLRFELSGGSGTAAARDVLQAYREGQSLVPLLEGGWARLPHAWLEQHADLLEQILRAREQAPGQSLPAHAGPAMLELCALLDTPPPLEFAALRTLLTSLSELPKAELPKDLKAQLREYQLEGVSWLSLMRRANMGAVLADDMGLGKTLQAICVLSGRCLVVCPTSVVHNWASELRKFRPELPFGIFHGKDRELDPTHVVTLTSYAILRLDQTELSGIDWDVVVLDEAQAIKNPESQAASAAFSLRAKFRLALTGTPVENRLDELWSQLHFTNPGLLGGRSAFAERFTEPIRSGNLEATARLRRTIAPFLLRRDKRSVAPELPPRTDIVTYCELSQEEQSVYSALHAATRRDVVKALREGSSNVMKALEALLRLRQAACHVGLLPGQHAGGSAKLERLLQALLEATADGHRALVFSQWTSLLDLVEPHLTEHSIRFGRLDGTTRDRKAVVDEFQSEAGPDVLLLSLKAGGTGLNLTAADHVFLLDPWWNPAVEQQAADRAHRIGQERPVFVHRLVARGTVEEKILLLQQEKRALAAAALDDAAQAGSLSREDLLALLE